MFEINLEKEIDSTEVMLMQKETEALEIKASLFIITNNKEYNEASNLLNTIRKKIKKIEEYRKSITDPINQQLKRIKEFFDTPINKLKKADNIIVSAMQKFQEEERKRIEIINRKLLEEQEKQKKKLEEKAKKLEEKGKLELAQKIKKDIQNIVAPVITVETKAKGTYEVEIWKFRVVDFEKIPREYLIVNEKMLNEIARQTKGTKNIPGIEFYSEKSIRTR